MLLEKIKANLSIIVFTLFLIVGFGLYANSFGNQFFWDDDDLVVNNVYVHDFNVVKFFTENEIAGIGQISNYWRPMTLISLALDYKLWGGAQPVGFHITGTLLHIFTAWLVFILLYKLLSFRKTDDKGGKALILAFLTSFIFLVHPLQTETIVYTAGRADPVSGFFVLLSLWFYVSFRLNSKAWQCVLALLFFVFGLLSKEQVVLLPILTLLIEAVFFIEKYDKKSILKSLKYCSGFFAILAVFLVLRLTVLNFNDILSGPVYDLDQVYSQNGWSRLFTFCLVMLSYFRLLFAPFGLVMAREVVPVLSFFSWPVLSFLVLSAGLLFLCVKTWKSDRLISFGLLWFLIILLPRTNILKINRPMYEHWLHLPMIGFWLAFFSLLFLLYAKIKTEKMKKIASLSFVVFCTLYLALFMVLTVLRNPDWREPISFYEKNLKHTPNSYIQHNNLGMAYANVGRVDEAIVEYRKAIAIKDIYPQIHYNLANGLLKIDRVDEAIEEYRKAIAISPGFFNPYANLLNVYMMVDNREAVKSVLLEMEKNFTNSADFWYLKGVVYYKWKERSVALEAFKKAAFIAPKDQAIQKALQAASRLK